ncbi:hypothetical protein O7623_08915 [Solwaraspora sp. WMMD791]|uniref:hypothetical protein n=1 Tax=Solwaraspora sp. WMMD791 TaxID=3016086 RepID=UPI00249B4465|nr:hypothetical protein [Solwaraspora sp. WMMD791]WFE29291.1 hypothetical protein O7623_08915 [Solwaraspora sp. WMMD791]
MPGADAADRYWAPVVYGRTGTADFWWRAVPEHLAHHRGWLESSVRAVVGGGTGLDRPRFVLSCDGDHLLVGVACHADQLNDRMNSHQGRRLYCFVGWMAPGGAGRAARSAPGLNELLRRWRAWAGPVYEEWVGRDWQQHPSDVRRPHRSVAAPAPWAEDLDNRDRPAVWRTSDGKLYRLTSRSGQVYLVQPDEAAALWELGLREFTEFTLVSGWTSAARAELASVTHLSADDVTRSDYIEVPGASCAASPSSPPNPSRSPATDRNAGGGPGTSGSPTAAGDAVIGGPRVARDLPRYGSIPGAGLVLDVGRWVGRRLTSAGRTVPADDTDRARPGTTPASADHDYYGGLGRAHGPRPTPALPDDRGSTDPTTANYDGSWD